MLKLVVVVIVVVEECAQIAPEVPALFLARALNPRQIRRTAGKGDENGGSSGTSRAGTRYSRDPGEDDSPRVALSSSGETQAGITFDSTAARIEFPRIVREKVPLKKKKKTAEIFVRTLTSSYNVSFNNAAA